MSVIDLFDAYHILRLAVALQKAEKSHNIMVVLHIIAQGISMNPVIWQQVIERVVDKLPHKVFNDLIIDDFMVFFTSNNICKILKLSQNSQIQ